MENTAAPSRVLPVTKSYHDAAALYGKHFLKFMGVACIPSAITFFLFLALKVSIIASLTRATGLTDVFSPYHISSALTIMLIAAIVLVQTIGVIALIYTVIKHETVSILFAFEHSLAFIVRFVAVSIAIVLVSLCGLLVGFIPVLVASVLVGLISVDLLNATFPWLALGTPIVSSIFSTFFIFSPYILIEKNCSIRTALHESPRLVRGHFWEIAIRLMIFYAAAGVLVFALKFIPGIGKLISLLTVTPFTVVYLYTLYQHLSALKR
jgi:hypothetical protein